MTMSSRVRLASVAALLITIYGGACGGGGGSQEVDAAIDAPPDDASTIDAPPDRGAVGSAINPAASCAEIRDAVGPKSGVYWLRHPDGKSPQFAVFCEQTLNGGGWAMVYNSVLTNGQTTAFWQFGYADRFKRFGVQKADTNFYDGSLYLLGKDYFDIITDLSGKTAVALEMSAIGIDDKTMRFMAPTYKTGAQAIFDHQFKGGWSAKDFDGDDNPSNCAGLFSSVAQHYSSCFAYNLGSDADGTTAPEFFDGGVGPHANSGTVLGPLMLTGDGSGFSRVKRIARFTRW